jgi:hypothetical protein
MMKVFLVIPFLLQITFMSYAFAESSSCHEDHTHHAHETTQSQSHHDQDTSHKTHCCSTHLITLLAPYVYEQFIPQVDSLSEFISLMKPAPDLDGPFQPPRHAFV